MGTDSIESMGSIEPPLSMTTTPTNMTIADYCKAMDRNEVVVNREYQRNDQVWPAPAQSFLIETILLGFPMPKLSLHQVTNLTERTVIKEIVDGQQRSAAILAYYHDKFKLSRVIETEALRGCSYSGLDDEYKQRFLDYSLSVDLFVGASPEQVREVFRRMNSYTMPLNPEEQRHAEFQGRFKWFVHRVARRFDEAFFRIGLFGQKALVRMQDTKLIAEIIHALHNGISTTKSEDLRALYQHFDETYQGETVDEGRLVSAFDQLLGWKDLHDTAIMRPHQIYALVLALIHMRRPVPALNGSYASPSLREFDAIRVLPRLTAMADALDSGEPTGRYEAFVSASAEKTNVAAQRLTRFVAYCQALDSAQHAKSK